MYPRICENLLFPLTVRPTLMILAIEQFQFHTIWTYGSWARDRERFLHELLIKYIIPRTSRISTFGIPTIHRENQSECKRDDS